MKVIIADKNNINICFELRTTVFVEEQNVPVEEEIDEDDKTAIHFLLFDNNKPIATARVINRLDHAIIGRVAVLKNSRGKGAGLFLMNSIIEYCKNLGIKKITLGAQQQALHFYDKLGFKVCSDKYLDANIPHYKMSLEI